MLIDINLRCDSDNAGRARMLSRDSCMLTLSPIGTASDTQHEGIEAIHDGDLHNVDHDVSMLLVQYLHCHNLCG